MHVKRFFGLAVVFSLSSSLLLGANSTLKIAGSSTVTPIVSKAAEQFKKQNPSDRVFVSPTGSGAGIQSLGSGTADIAMISREVDPEEEKKFSQTKFNVISVARDAVIPAVSAAVYDAGVTAVTLQTLRKIYSGKIENWKELGGPDARILVIDKEASRGTRHVFMEAVFGNKKAKAKGALLVTGSNNEEQAAISQSKSAIGMLSNAWLNDKVKGLAIEKDGRVIQATEKNIRKGIFPISRNLNLVTNGKPTGLTKKFIDYVLSPAGQKIVTDLDYVPVRQAQRNIN